MNPRHLKLKYLVHGIDSRQGRRVLSPDEETIIAPVIHGSARLLKLVDGAGQSVVRVNSNDDAG